MSVTESSDNVEVSKPLDGNYNLYRPFKYLESDQSENTILLILNQKIDGVNLKQLWNCTQLHLCADGGADQLYSYFETEEERSRFIPHFITGDLDSITDQTKDYYSQKGTVVIKQLTQYSTDFHKCLQLGRLYFHKIDIRPQLFENPTNIDDYDGLSKLVDKFEPSHDQLYIYALGGIGGRFDQTIGSMHVLYKLEAEIPNIELVFITKLDIIFLISKGVNYIEYPLKQLWNARDTVPVCGLLPLGNKSVFLNTKGLKYDVSDWKSDMLDKVSSSNGISGTNGVIIETTDSIVVNIVVDHHRID